MANPLAFLRARYGAGALVAAAAIPFLFLHRHYQPSASAAGLDVDLSDLAVLAVVLAGAAELRTARRLPGSRWIWVAAAALLVWIGVSTVYGRLLHSSYPFRTHAVTALKFGEYALLAPAVALLLRRRGSARPLFGVAVAWSCFLSAIAVLQFLGVVPEFKGIRPGQREPSYIGVHDLGGFSGSVLALALIAIVLGLPQIRDRRGTIVAGVTGGLGVALAAALDSVGGMFVAALTLWLIALRRHAATRRRTVGLVALVAVVGLAALTLRASAIQAFLRFVGVERQSRQASGQVQTYAHRTLLAYIGLRIWIHHPLLGVGWQGSGEPFAFQRELPAAHRRFHSEPSLAFPSPQHAWGVQNGIVQALADMGPLGLALFLLVFTVPFALAAATAARGPPARTVTAALACCCLIFALAVFTGSGIVSGAPLDALLWIGVGLAATATAPAS